MKKESEHPERRDPGATGKQSFSSSEDSSSASAEPMPSAAEIEELKKLAAKGKEAWDQLMRTAAEFDNFKKRALRERQDAERYKNESLLQKLIPVLDNFDMAMAVTTGTTNQTVQSLQVGVNMILQQLRRALSDVGLQELDASGKVFDPTWHEAVSEQESTAVPEGHVVQQIRKGYKLHDRLLRPAGVIVARKPSAHPADASTSAPA